MAALLPKLPRPIYPAWIANDLFERIRHPLFAEVGQLPSGILAHIAQRASQAFIVKIFVKQNQMQMRGHDAKGIDAQSFVFMATIRQGSSAINTGNHSTTVKVR